jgi:hypothetical protein
MRWSRNLTHFTPAAESPTRRSAISTFKVLGTSCGALPDGRRTPSSKDGKGVQHSRLPNNAPGTANATSHATGAEPAYVALPSPCCCCGGGCCGGRTWTAGGGL